MSIREKTLDDAKEIVCKDRNQQYGEPENNFKAIAEFWNTYLYYRGIIQEMIQPWDVPVMMELFKNARLSTAKKPSYDSFVDICGYAACAAELVEGDKNGNN